MTTASCRTLERDHQVAFFAIEGTLAHRETPAVHAIVETTRGVDESSVRVSAELVAFDAGHPLVDLQQRIEPRLKSRGLRLSPIRVMGRQPAAGH